MAANLDVEIETIISETEKELKIDNGNANGDDNTANGNGSKTNSPNNFEEIDQASLIVDAKQRKKLDKFLDNLFKKTGLNNLNSNEDKLYALANKYAELLESNKQKDNSFKDSQKNVQALIKQRDLLQHDNSKQLLARNKLESLCRELQRHNKAIKDENLTRTKEEEEKRKEISNKFQAAIDEINQQVQANTERNNQLIQENVQLAAKLKTLLEQYEVREQHIDKVLKHKDLENQLANAKFQQAELRITELTERNKKYEEILTEMNKKCEFHVHAENQLKLQLKLYTEKYEEFQQVLDKSNKDFITFRTEMEKMTKKIKKLEQETQIWRAKWENCNKTLAQVVEQKEEIEKDNKKKQLKADTLEQLCRTLQTERTTMQQKLKSYEEPAATTVVDVAKPHEVEQQQPSNESESHSPEPIAVAVEEPAPSVSS